MFGRKRSPQDFGGRPYARRPVSSTDSGRRSASAYSYYSGGRRSDSAGEIAKRPATKRTQSNDERYTEPTRGPSKHWRNLPSYAAFAAVMAGVLFTLSLSSSPRVVIEQVDGVTLTRSTEEYVEQSTQIWQNSWHTKTKLTLNADDISQDIRNTYTELADVRVQVPLLGRRPTIVLVPSRAALKLQAQNGTFFLDSDGRALVDATTIDQSTRVPRVRDQSDVAVEPGKTILPREHVAFLLQLSAQLSAQGLGGDLALSNGVVGQVEFRPTGTSYMVKFLLDAPATVRQAVGSYIAVKDRLTGEGKTPSQYIDVRIPDKVFIK